MNAAALDVFRAGHLAVTGEALRAAADRARRQRDLPPRSRGLLARCDAVLRVGGASPGADEMVAMAGAANKPVYTGVAELP
jgi:hypothetical protein